MNNLKAAIASMRISGIFLSALLVAAGFLSSCDDKDDNYSNATIDKITDDVAITAFNLNKKSAVLHNLDSVYFSIDLENARIYNADSLPVGTDVSALSFNIETGELSEVMVYGRKPDDPEVEKKIDYLANASAEFNFAAGEVRIHVVSADGSFSRDYFVNVNVHKVAPDSLYWSEIARTTLPTSLRNPVAQKSVAFGGELLCLTTDGSDFCMARSSDPYGNTWVNSSVTFPVDVDVESFTATDDALYILAADGSLLTSADGSYWSDTDSDWHSITAPYKNMLLGVEKSAGKYYHTSYPGGRFGELPEDFPVSGQSAPALFTSRWAAEPQILILGGRKADDGLTGAAWAFDGSQWALFSNNMPAAEGYAVANYMVAETDTVSWRIHSRPVVIAFGGKTDAGINRNVYISRDFGLNWQEGSKYIQLPEYFPDLYGADLLVFNTTFSVHDNVRTGRGWCSFEVPRIPAFYIVPAPLTPRSRAVAPVDSWECPYMYMIGGSDADGHLQPSVWRGVINHFSFRPLF